MIIHMVFLDVHMFLCLEARKMQRRRFPALGGKESGGAASLPINSAGWALGRKWCKKPITVFHTLEQNILLGQS